MDSFCRPKLCNGMVSSLFLWNGVNIIGMLWFECSFGWKFLFVESYLQDSCWFIIMATIASKRKLNTKFIKDKYSALKEVEDGKRKLQVAAKYGIPKNTLSTWLKNKDKIFEAMKKGSNSKRQRLRKDTCANLDQAMYKWLLVVWSRDVAVSALVFKAKAVEFPEKMNVENFKTSAGWPDHWKNLGNKLRYQLFCPNKTSTRSTTPMNLACFIALNQISPYIWRMKIVLVVNTGNCVWQGWQQLMHLKKNYPCL